MRCSECLRTLSNVKIRVHKESNEEFLLIDCDYCHNVEEISLNNITKFQAMTEIIKGVKK